MWFLQFHINNNTFFTSSMYFFATSAKNAVEGPSHRGLCGLQIAIIPFSLFGFGTFEALSKKRWSADSKKKSGSKKKST